MKHIDDHKHKKSAHKIYEAHIVLLNYKKMAFMGRNWCILKCFYTLPSSKNYQIIGCTFYLDFFFTLEKIEKMLKCHKNITNDVQVVKLKK